ncbi:MAG TPA: hypothetical protein VIK63_06140 [Haloplasmataceae bacterium]
MNRESKPILYALVVAYKNGIINKKPLLKWTDPKRIIQRIMKYMGYIILFSTLILLTNEGYLIDLDEKVAIGNYLIDAYRLLNVLFFLPIVLSFANIWRFMSRVSFVLRALKTYRYHPDDIEALDRITYKIKV